MILHNCKSSSMDNHTLTVEDKCKILYKQHFDVITKDFSVNIKLENLEIKNAGVLSIKLNVTDEVISELLIFIKPETTLETEIILDKSTYIPKDDVCFTIRAKESCYCAVIVTDESAFLDIEARRYPVSLTTKVFLEKELHFKAK